MDSGDDGVINVSYRPLATLDGLHAPLLAASATQPSDVVLLERIFSLPANVVAKEMDILGSYGLVRMNGLAWKATSRGLRLVKVWDAFEGRCEIDVKAIGREWLLGPGEYALDELIRDVEEVEALARKLGVGDAASALGFLNERRKAAENLEAFLTSLPLRRDGETKDGPWDEVPFFDRVGLAETDEALTRLRDALGSHLDAQIGGRRGGREAGAQGDGLEGRTGCDLGRIERSRGIMKRFDKEARAQRTRNRHLSEAKTLCEGRLAGMWLVSALGPLSDAYRAEPAAFVFRSSVPRREMETKMLRPAAPTPAPTPDPVLPRREEGLLRSLIRWLFG